MSELEKDNQATMAESAEQEAMPESSIDPAILEEMVKAGVLYGRKKSKTIPKMRPYIHNTRNNIEIFDPVLTLDTIQQAGSFLEDVVKKGGLILLVGTLPASKGLIRDLGEKHGFPYVSERWLGGTLTNFKTLSERIRYYMNLKADRESGKLEKYTKKERVEFDKEITRLTTLFSGLEKLTRNPDVLLIVDTIEHHTAVREAKRLGIPTIALINSNGNPEDVTHPIPCNSSAKSGISWVLRKLEEAIERGQKAREELKLAKPAETKNDGNQ